jgi:hypothetical protein
MALPLDFSLRLEDCNGQRVLVSALLRPSAGVVRLEGVALQVVAGDGEPLGVRMLLPIAGELHHPMLSTVELKCGELPRGARVVGTAWMGVEVVEAVLPTEPFTELGKHVRARSRLASFAPATELELVEGAERRRLVALYPWIDEPRVPKVAGELDVVADADEADVVDEIVDGLGLDEESAEWLKDLLQEE